MPYLNEAGLTRYDSQLKEWISSQPVKTLPSSLYPWTLTDKAGAVTCWPVGGMELKPTVDFMFTETGPAEGDKGPENPSTISGVNSVKVTRCGDNILPGNRKSNYAGEAGTFSTDADGYVSYSAMSDGRASVYSVCNAQLYLHAGQQYVLHVEVKTAATSTYRAIQILDENNTSILYVYPGDSDSSHTFTPSHDGMYGVLYKIYDGIYRFSLYLGSTATTFEPYSGTDYTIDLGGTYYGGILDVATGVMTVTREAIPAAGALSFYWSDTTALSSCAIFRATLPHMHGSQSTCNKFVVMSGSQDSNDAEHYRLYGPSGTSAAIQFWISKSRFPGLSPSDDGALWRIAATQWLSDNDVVVVYQLAVPYTVQLTPQQILSFSQFDKYTPRLNTIYTDASVVQVGYVKSPIREEQELTQAIVSQGGNI